MITCYVNTASTPGGDGTTNATTGDNRAYASLNEAEAARQQVLSEPIEIICEGATVDTTAVTIDGWTTSAANYIKIYTTTAARHDGKWDEGKYRLEVNDNLLRLYEAYIKIDGLQTRVTSSAADYSALELSIGADYNEISNCIFRGNGTTNGKVTNNGGIDAKFWNCISYNFNSGFRNHSGNSYFYNCTAYGNNIGFHRLDGTMVAKNNITQSCTTGFSGTFSSDSTNNLSDDATYASSTADIVNTHVLFADEDNDDFHLASNDAGARNYGIDLSADDNLPFSTDIDGQARTSPWDIGADEYVAAEVEFIPRIIIT